MSRARSPRYVVAAGTALAVVAVETVVVVRRDPTYALVGDQTLALLLEIAAAIALLAAAGLTWRTGAVFPTLLVATAATWLVAEWDTPVAGAAFTAGLVLYAAWAPLLGTAALVGPGGDRLDRAGRALMTVAFSSGVGLLGLGFALVFDPTAQGCTACPANVLHVADAPALGQALTRAGLLLTALWTAGFTGLAIARLVPASPARRRWSAPVLVPAAVALALWGVDALHGLERGFVSNDRTDRALRTAQAVALVLVAAGVALTRLRARRARTALSHLVLDIGAAPKPGELRAWLSTSLDDPSLALRYPLDDTWIDVDGQDATLAAPGGQETTRVRAGGKDVFAVVHRRGLLDDPTLISELVTTASLAVEHDRLHAVRRARIEQLRASRARIVAVADSQRRRLERDLHDGAQQRLVALALALRLARRTLAPGDDELGAGLDAAEQGVRDAVVALREVAHGLFPAVLAEEGLAAALEELSEQVPRLVPGSLPSGRFPAEVESAAYFATVESLRLTTGEVSVDVVSGQGRLEVVVAPGEQTDGAMQQIHDRVGAVGGSAVVCDGRLRVEMPCGS